MYENLNKTLLRIEELCKEYHWTHYKLAKEANIPLSSLNGMFQRNTCPTVPTLEKICSGFQISLSDFFNYDQLPYLAQISSDAYDLIERYTKLSKYEQLLLQAYLDGLQRVDFSHKKGHKSCKTF